MVDFLDELLADGDDKEDKKEVVVTDELANLKAEIAELNKEKSGLLKGVKAERGKRQDLSTKFNQLSDTVSQVLANRENTAANIVSEAADANRKAAGLPVSWTEDGEGFVDASTQIEEALQPYQDEIINLKQQLELTNNRSAAESEAEKVRRSIVGQDERYNTQYNKYQAARRWIVDQIADYANTNSWNRPMQSGEALDLVFEDSDLQAEWSEQFEGLDLDTLVTAEDSKRHFAKTLEHMAVVATPDETTLNPNSQRDSRFQKVMQKPAGLGSTTNAKAGNLSVMDRVRNLTPEQLMDMDDATAAKLEQMLKDDESNGGVNF